MMAGQWYYWRSEKTPEHELWTVGIDSPNARGGRTTDSDWGNRDEARERVNYLNGGLPPLGPPSQEAPKPDRWIVCTIEELEALPTSHISGGCYRIQHLVIQNVQETAAAAQELAAQGRDSDRKGMGWLVLPVWVKGNLEY